MASVLQTSGATPCRIAAAEPRAWKSRLDEPAPRRWNALPSENRSAPNCCGACGVLVDGQLKRVWEPPRDAAGAHAGCGWRLRRGQLFPYSDIDLLVLLPAASDPGQTPKLEQFVGMLWISDSKWATVFAR